MAATYNDLASKIMHSVGDLDWTKPLQMKDGNFFNIASKASEKMNTGECIPDNEQTELLEELDEHVPFLCSVSNDCQRLIDSRLIDGHTETQDANEDNAKTDQTLVSHQKCI